MKEISKKMKADLEYGILSVELDIKLFRKRLLSNTDEEFAKALEKQIAELEGGQQLLKEKLSILELHKDG